MTLSTESLEEEPTFGGQSKAEFFFLSGTPALCFPFYFNPAIKNVKKGIKVAKMKFNDQRQRNRQGRCKKQLQSCDPHKIWQESD